MNRVPAQELKSYQLIATYNGIGFLAQNIIGQNNTHFCAWKRHFLNVMLTETRSDNTYAESENNLFMSIRYSYGQC